MGAHTNFESGKSKNAYQMHAWLTFVNPAIAPRHVCDHETEENKNVADMQQAGHFCELGRESQRRGNVWCSCPNTFLLVCTCMSRSLWTTLGHTSDCNVTRRIPQPQHTVKSHTVPLQNTPSLHVLRRLSHQRHHLTQEHRKPAIPNNTPSFPAQTSELRPGWVQTFENNPLRFPPNHQK